MSPEQIAKAVRQARTKLDWSRQTLQDKSKISASTIKRIENGVPNIKRYNLDMVLKALDLSPEEIRAIAIDGMAADPEPIESEEVTDTRHRLTLIDTSETLLEWVKDEVGVIDCWEFECPDIEDDKVWEAAATLLDAPSAWRGRPQRRPVSPDPDWDNQSGTRRILDQRRVWSRCLKTLNEGGYLLFGYSQEKEAGPDWDGPGGDPYRDYLAVILVVLPENDRSIRRQGGVIYAVH